VTIYQITLRDRETRTVLGYYNGAWTTDRHRAIALPKREVAEDHAARMRDLCPRNAELINVEEIAAADKHLRAREQMPRQIRLSLEGRCSMWSIFPAAAILLAQAQPDPAEKWCLERGQNGAQLCESAAMGLTNAAPAKSGYAAAPARIVIKFRRLIPSPVDPMLGMDYGSIELLPKGWTNGDFPPN
jgi:hypothetical protein